MGNAAMQQSLPRSIVVGKDGLIAAVGPAAEIEKNYAGCSFDKEIDATGRIHCAFCKDQDSASFLDWSMVIPTYFSLSLLTRKPVYAGDRVNEYRMKLEGATYMDIHRIGGGIGFTVRHTHEAFFYFQLIHSYRSEDELLENVKARLMTMLRHGTTLAECKSGYGLVTEDEIKLLRVLQRVKKEVPVDIVMNLLAAHSVPAGYTSEEATQMIINEMIPKAIALKEKGELDIELIDISKPPIFGIP